MRRIWDILALAVLAAVTAESAAQGNAGTAGKALAEEAVVNGQIFSAGDDPYPRHAVAFPGGVTGVPDVTYEILSGFRPGTLDLYLPPRRFSGLRPTVVFIHGGGWVGGGKRLSGAFDNWPNVLASMARRGYVVAAVSYRFSGEAPFPAAIQDVKAAIRWLRANSSEYRIDKGRFMTFGGSAGGQLAALAATSCGIVDLMPADSQVATRNSTVESPKAGTVASSSESDCVQGAVAWYGIFDFATMPGRENERGYLGCGRAECTPEQMSRASARSYLSDNTPPILLIAGADDRTVPPQQSLDFHAAMQARGLKSEIHIIPGVDHSFIGKTPEQTRAASREALALTFDFFDRQIGDRAPR